MSSGPQKIHSLRVRITGVTVLFTLVLTLAFGSVSFFLFRNSARASVLSSAEFNLQLVAQLAEQDLIELNSLANRQALDQSLAGYLSSPFPSRRQALDIHSNMAVFAASSRSYAYLQRFLATDGADRLLHVYPLTNSVPVNRYTIQTLPGLDGSSPSVWQKAFHDPLLTTDAPDSLLTVHPVYNTRIGKRVGMVYLTASVRLFTDRLSSYAGDALAGQVYLRTGEGLWQLDGDRMVPAELDIAVSRRDKTATRAPTTLIQNIRTRGGEEYTLVTCPVGNFGVSLTHRLPASALFGRESSLWVLMLCIVLVVLLTSLALFWYMNHLIVRPVAKLRAHIGRISAGDFTSDPSIEWPDELGDVGRGVNQLSRNMRELLARRVADEQERQSLEYKMLQNQVNPHFIYNTLNSIKWMAALQGASGISEMTTAFARLLKSVAKSNRPLHTLREEFALLNDYCTIQQYRYGGAITIEIAEISDERLCECLIPSFSLQPLAENAIFHGIEPKGGVGSVWLHIHQTTEGDVRIVMQDDGVGMTQAAIDAVFRGEDPQKEFRQVGLRNVHRRIQYAFGPQYGLSISSRPGEYTRVEIRIPCRSTHADSMPTDERCSEGAEE